MVLITGLTGLVGSGLMAHMVGDASFCKSVVALCRDTSNVSFLEKHCKVERGSTWDEDRLDEICDKYDFDTLIHISNKGQILQFAKLASKHRFKKVIMVSSTYACSEKHPDNDQLRLENESASVLEKAGIDYVFLRPTSIFGTRPDGVPDRNLSHFIKWLNWPLFPLFSKGKATVRPLWGKDVGLALYLCIKHFNVLKGKRLICSGDKTRSFKELMVDLARITHKKARFFYIPGWFGKMVFGVLYYVSFHKIDYREPIDRLLENRAFDTSPELLDLGYGPTDFASAVGTYQITY